jgi:2'-5' RNA ligase
MPEWFDNFILKYNEPLDLHLTLIQPRYIDEQQIDDIKSKVALFLNENKLAAEDKIIEFDNFVCDKESNGKYTIMLLASNDDVLLDFQKGLREILKDNIDYVEKATVEYEENFRPHITIGTNISEDLLNEAKSYFQSEFQVTGELTDLVLPIVKDTSIEERGNKDNQIIFDL